MIADEGLVYSISDDGIALCVEAETGDVIYRKRIGGNFSASPLMASGRIYLTSEQGLTTVLRAGREFQQLAENDIGQRTLASLAVIDNSILLRTVDALYRIGR
jgi:outer membrane protein assembly factor BamB